MGESATTSSSQEEVVPVKKPITFIDTCTNHSNAAAEKRLLARIDAEDDIPHEHGHSHSHEEDEQSKNKKRLAAMITLTFIFFLVELIFGFINRSVALLADSYHMLSDVMALIVAFICVTISRKLSATNGFGWVRAEVLGAQINGTFLLCMCFMITLEAIRRIIHPEKMQSPLQVLIVGVIGLLINFVGIFIFHGHGHSHGGGGHGHSHDSHKKEDKTKRNGNSNSHDDEHELVERHDSQKKNGRSLSQISNEVSHNLSMIVSGSKQHLALQMVTIDDGTLPQEEFDDEDEEDSAERIKAKTNRNLNMHGVFLHILTDAIGSVFVILTATVAYCAPLSWDPVVKYMDPALSLFLVGLIFSSAFGLVKETSAIILGKPPYFIDYVIIKRDLAKIVGVAAVLDCRVWTLVSNRHIATVTIEFCTAAAYDQAYPKIRKVFHNNQIHVLFIQPSFSSTHCRIASPIIEPIAETPESEDLSNNNDNVQEPLLKSEAH